MPVAPVATPAIPTCKKCGKKKKLEGPYCGLCADELDRNRRRAQRQAKDQRDKDFDSWDPTEEELDALIAEQMKNLPPWWHKAEEVQRATGGTVPMD